MWATSSTVFKSRYDAILLDVDNGPAGLMCAANDDLYDPYGLLEAQKALRPGGILAIWSAAPDEAFAAKTSPAWAMPWRSIACAPTAAAPARAMSSG